MSEFATQPHDVIVARASRPGPLPFVLKEGETFAVFDPLGDIHVNEGGDLGVFHEGARHISRLELRLWGEKPLLLSSTVREDHCMLVAHLMNTDLEAERSPSGRAIEKGVVHVQRATVLAEAACLQQLAITNYSGVPLTVPITIHFDADFRDIFEVRGMRRARCGHIERDVNPQAVRLRYFGLDGRMRVSSLHIGCDLEAECDGRRFLIEAMPRQTVRVCYAIDFHEQRTQPLNADGHFEQAATRSIERFRTARAIGARIESSNEGFNHWASRSFADVHLLATEQPSGLYPYAGVPWFCAPFGRDGIITAMQMLAIEPGLARGVLGYLAATQADSEDPARDAEPGKILHEARLGEMAALGEVPFRQYYGSIDATPLFVMLAWDYLVRTADREFIESIWDNIIRALRWMREYGDRDGDGLVEYGRRVDAGLRNQGWKDSEDSISHADGSLARGPIAVCEVQAYVYGALRSAANLCNALGRPQEAGPYDQEAAALRVRFEARFWRPKLGTYALALDGEKRPCDVRASNAGHALWTSIADPAKARSVAQSLMAPSMFSGWGVRTLDAREWRYNPMSYHNGSVWPHDNAIIAAGLSRYGCKKEALRILTSLYEATLFMPMHRLPELFCGFPRREDEGPTLYPVACVPQAWASGAVFTLLDAALGMLPYVNLHTGRPTIRFEHPRLPGCLDSLEILNLRVGDEEVDLRVHRYGEDVDVTTSRRSPHVEVLISK